MRQEVSHKGLNLEPRGMSDGYFGFNFFGTQH
jgi:hypothetical protein